jgi:DNA-directed RNA polymerase subunit F
MAGPGALRRFRIAAAARAASACLFACSAACHGSGEVAADAGAHHTTADLTAEQAAQVLAKVGDTTITLGDFAAALEHMDQFDRLRYQSTERRKELLDEMINIKLLAAEARDKGYDKDPRTQEELRAVLRDAMLKEARKGAPMPAEIPADEVKAYYDSHRGEFRDPERRRVSAIVLPTAAAAQAVLDQVKGGVTAEQWGNLVRTKSIDVGAKANVPVDLAGDLGMCSPPGEARGDNPRISEPVRVAAFGIAKVGDVASQVTSAYGRYYVIRLTVKTDPQDRSFKESERSIRVELSQAKLHEKEDELLSQLRTKFPVRVDDAVMATVKVDVPDGGFPAEPKDGAAE